jgi:ParB family chromosome partitioning protein
MSNDRKRVLGRGLEALLSDAGSVRTPKNTNQEIVSEHPVSAGIATIPLSSIETNPFQPRTEFDKDALLELSLSIKELGIIQPITVRKLSDNKYQLISGERRMRASIAAGLKEIPAYVRIANDQSMLEMALVENIQRRDLNPIEIAISYKRLVDECGLTQEELAERVGKNRTSTSNYLRLLKLPAEIQNALIQNQITFGHARALITVDDEDVQLYIFDKAIQEGWSVRKIEDSIRESKEVTHTAPDKKEKTSISFIQQKYKDDLSNRLKTKVALKANTKGGGNIVIPFKSDADLERIIELLDV